MSDVLEAIKRYLAKYPDGYDQDGGYARFSEHDRLIIDRLAGSERALAAISAITNTDSGIWKLLEMCMQAEGLMQTFHQELAQKRERIEHLQRPRKNVEELRQFVAESFRIILNWPVPEAETKYQQALDHIDALISLRKQAAESGILDLGATRKIGVIKECVAKTATKTAAIGDLAEQVAKAFGKPFAQHVAVLAEVALDIGEVPEDRVRKALKMRRQKRNDARLVRSTR
jgi:hypothetical protein